MSQPAKRIKNNSKNLRLVSDNKHPDQANRFIKLVKRQYPSLMVLILATSGIVVANVNNFRIGTYILAGSLVLATIFRLTMTRFAVGWLAVRHRALDTAILLGFTVALVVLAIVVPA